MFKFSIYFIISFIILSFPLKGKKLFHYLDHMAAPYLSPVMNKGYQSASQKLSKVKFFGIKLLGSSSSDKVATKLSAPQRREDLKNKFLAKPKKEIDKKVPEPKDLERKSQVDEAEFYSDEELDQLKQMILKSEI